MVLAARYIVLYKSMSTFVLSNVNSDKITYGYYCCICACDWLEMVYSLCDIAIYSALQRENTFDNMFILIVHTRVPTPTIASTQVFNRIQHVDIERSTTQRESCKGIDMIRVIVCLTLCRYSGYAIYNLALINSTMS